MKEKSIKVSKWRKLEYCAVQHKRLQLRALCSIAAAKRTFCTDLLPFEYILAIYNGLKQ